MLAAGYRAVGKDFPVFLHPQTREEHALARTERKTGPGYRGFAVHAGAEVSLEEDLSRRDLSVNAIARDENGALIDPYGGRRDLEARVLRHVSPAFAEDPVRILRVARFAARFAGLGFHVAADTLALMRDMVQRGEADHLVPERVWKETERALSGDGRDEAAYRPGVFFETLHACGALARVMPELAALSGVPQRADYHPEVDTLVHTLMCVDTSARMGFALPVRVAALLHDLGKAATPSAEWPSHRMHDARGLPLVEQFCARLRLPNAQRELALAVTRDHLLVHRALELRPGTLLELLERFRAFQRGEFFEQALDACLCDARGRLGKENSDYPPVAYLRAAREQAAVVQAAAVVADGLTGPAVGEELRRRRVAVLAAFTRRNGAMAKD
jgi:tRNA nucleotidyltransferase (CCA-adding enzyme)